MFIKPIQIIVVINCLFFSCNYSQNSEKQKLRKPYLLYFNANDTLTFQRYGMLDGIPMPDGRISKPRRFPFYSKGKSIKYVGMNQLLGVIEVERFQIGSYSFLSQSKHEKYYFPKDSLDNYEIVKTPFGDENIKLIDLTNADSAFIFIVDRQYIEQ